MLKFTIANYHIAYYIVVIIINNYNSHNRILINLKKYYDGVNFIMCVVKRYFHVHSHDLLINYYFTDIIIMSKH